MILFANKRLLALAYAFVAAIGLNACHFSAGDQSGLIEKAKLNELAKTIEIAKLKEANKNPFTDIVEQNHALEDADCAEASVLVSFDEERAQLLARLALADLDAVVDEQSPNDLVGHLLATKAISGETGEHFHIHFKPLTTEESFMTVMIDEDAGPHRFACLLAENMSQLSQRMQVAQSNGENTAFTDSALS